MHVKTHGLTQPFHCLTCHLSLVSNYFGTGELFTLAVLDREREGEYDLVVKATDGGGHSCQADVMLLVQDMNDNPPQFSTNHYEITVFDNTTVRTPIAVIYAKDPDTGMEFGMQRHKQQLQTRRLFLVYLVRKHSKAPSSCLFA